MHEPGRDNILEIQDLKKHFRLKKGKTVKAVDGVSLSIGRGETLGLVGESGCGKSTLGRTVTRIYDPTAGTITFNGQDITHTTPAAYKRLTRKMQVIFQDPYASLDGRMTTSEIISEGMVIHKMHSGPALRERVAELLALVGLNKEHAGRFPHEFSGGQRQRIGIARALAIEPEFIVCDEPISALDVSVQAQIVNLLIRLQRDLGLTFLFIAHDLSMVRHISDYVAVMYLGTIVELTKSSRLYEHPEHPYTKSLLSAIPVPDPIVARQRNRILLQGEIPTPIDTPPGCKFKSRCRHVQPVCDVEAPQLKEIEAGHQVACHLFA